MKKFFVTIIMLLFVAGCGSGGNDGNSESGAKVSAIDGEWQHIPTENSTTLTNLHLLKEVSFSNGKMSAFEGGSSNNCDPSSANYIACLMSTPFKTRSGQFTVTGNILTITDIIINDDPSWGKYTAICTFTVNNGVLILTNNAGTATFIKQ